MKWKNRITEQVYLIISNTSDLYFYFKNITIESLSRAAYNWHKEALGDSPDTHHRITDHARFRVQKKLESWLEEGKPALQDDHPNPEVVNTIYNEACNLIDYREIAEELVAEHESPYESVSIVSCEDFEVMVDKNNIKDYIKEQVDNHNWMVRWTMPGCIDSGTWHFGDSIAEALHNYYKSLEE